jgi:hypothetical protein
MILYHGSTICVEKPEIRPSSATRDFGAGFYCTDIQSQAEKWAQRQGRIRKQSAILNFYEFDIERAKQDLKINFFSDYGKEWLELVLNCRKNPAFKHGFDIVYGKIANDDVGETVQAVLDGLMPPDHALQKLAFMNANNQYCFCTEKSLAFIKFVKYEELK